MFKPNNAALVNHNAPWKVIMIGLLVLIALIYALPNVFGESLAVQISPKNGNPISPANISTIEHTLSENHIPYFGLTASPYTVEMRFHHNSDQMQAQNVLQQALGHSYSVAINLAPNTPHWLQSLGASPMKLGLDLRGGMYFLLDIDMQSVLDNRISNMQPEITQLLRTEDLPWDSLKMMSGEGLEIQLLSVSAAIHAKALLTQKFPSLVVSQDAAHPQILHLTLNPAIASQAKQYAVEQTVQVMRNRVNALGVSEASVSKQGSDQVVIELPGLQDAARAKAIIGGTATLKVMLVDDNPSDQSMAASGQIPYGTVILRNKTGEPVLLQNQIIITGNSVVGADASFDSQTNQPVVNVTLSGPEVSHFTAVTSAHVGHPMAIVLVDQSFHSVMHQGKSVTVTQTHQTVVSVATIDSALGNNFQITGIGNYRMAQDLALTIRSGSLPAPVQVVEEQTIGPTLGAQNIHTGTISIFVAMILVMLFILFYYRFFGLIANIALMLNLIFIIAVMSLIPGATLSLPGIAGIVLNVGMAIDANVLIFERIREELKNGVTPQVAIHAGYARAFSTIVDSNMTTLIVAVILFAIGTGSVQGFAVTLMIGIITSMFTSIVVTRTFVNAFYGQRRVKSLSIGIRVQEKNNKENKEKGGV